VTTARLYYGDAYTHAFDAQVVEKSADGKRVYLDRTYFYPTSGGQPHDTGDLSGAAVTEVVDEGERIAHVLAEPIEGDLVQARIDWNRRFDHMQQHSGQHVLSAVFLERFGFETLSFHMGAEVSTVDLGTKELTPEQIAAAEERINEIVQAAVPLSVSFENAASVQALRKESRRTGTLRVIEIQDVDRSACGGTHVRSTAEIGPVQIRGSEKVRGNVRLEFICGTRAIRRSRRDFQVLAELGQQSAAPPEKLVDPPTVTRSEAGERKAEGACRSAGS
jgi:alanyl-tRNA synthetase